MAQDPDALGPVGYLVAEFPGNKMTGNGLAALLDLAFVMVEGDGSVHAIDLSDIDGDGELDLTVFEGAASGLLGESDHAEVASAVEAGSSAAILVYENRWAIPFVQGIRSSGGEVVAAGFIPHDDLAASADAAGL
jgi:hypothetical protein